MSTIQRISPSPPARRRDEANGREYVGREREKTLYREEERPGAERVQPTINSGTEGISSRALSS